MSCNGDYCGIIFDKEHRKQIEWALGIREFTITVDKHINLRDLEKAVNYKILKDGYIYVNQIYEMCEVKFDPHCDQNWLIESHVIFEVFSAKKYGRRLVIVRW